MAAKDDIGRASEALRRNPYIQRLLEDEEVRGNLLSAFDLARDAYGRMNNGKPAAKALLEDKRLKRDLAQAASALREASQALKAGPKRKRRGGIGRSLVVMIAGAVLALALSESLRSKVLDLLFGPEEEFQYNPTSAPAEEQSQQTAEQPAAS
jgi:hypothetical protein